MCFKLHTLVAFVIVLVLLLFLGYLYAYNLIEGQQPIVFGSGKLSNKSKKLSFSGVQLAKYTPVPSTWCSEIHILFYSK